METFDYFCSVKTFKHLYYENDKVVVTQWGKKGWLVDDCHRNCTFTGLWHCAGWGAVRELERFPRAVRFGTVAGNYGRLFRL